MTNSPHIDYAFKCKYFSMQMQIISDLKSLKYSLSLRMLELRVEI